MGAGNQGLEGGQVDVQNLIVFGIGVGSQRHKILLAALGLEECAGDLVGGEDGGGGAQLGAHIGDGGTLGHAQGADTLAAPLNDGAHTALDRQLAQNLQTHVLGGDKGAQLTGQLHLVHLGHGDVVGTAAHSHRHVQTARTHGQHTDAATGGGVAVGADEGLAGFAEALQMHLMADAVAGAGEVDAVLFTHRLDIAVVVGVLKAGLQGVVVDIGHAALGAHAGDTHRLEFEIGHSTGGILRQRLIDLQRDLGAGNHLAADQMVTDNLLCNGKTHRKHPFFTLKGKSNIIWYYTIVDKSLSMRYCVRLWKKCLFVVGFAGKPHHVSILHRRCRGGVPSPPVQGCSLFGRAQRPSPARHGGV